MRPFARPAPLATPAPPRPPAPCLVRPARLPTAWQLRAPTARLALLAAPPRPFVSRVRPAPTQTWPTTPACLALPARLVLLASTARCHAPVASTPMPMLPSACPAPSVTPVCPRARPRKPARRGLLQIVQRPSAPTARLAQSVQRRQRIARHVTRAPWQTWPTAPASLARPALSALQALRRLHPALWANIPAHRPTSASPAPPGPLPTTQPRPRAPRARLAVTARPGQ